MGLEGSVGFGRGCTEAEWSLKVKWWVGCCGRIDGVVGGSKGFRPCDSVGVGWGAEEDKGEVCELNQEASWGVVP